MPDDDWVADVKRWVQTRQPTNLDALARRRDDSTAVDRAMERITAQPTPGLGTSNGGFESR